VKERMGGGMAPRTIDDRIREDLKDPEFAQNYAQALEAWDLVIRLTELRKRRGFTQAQLAKMVGTKQQNIARIENPAYEGHSLGLLRRVARALGMVVRVEFVAPSVVIEEQAPATTRLEPSDAWPVYPDLPRDLEEERLRRWDRVEADQYAQDVPEGLYSPLSAHTTGGYGDAK